jgi:hypothetical protein
MRVVSESFLVENRGARGRARTIALFGISGSERVWQAVGGLNDTNTAVFAVGATKDLGTIPACPTFMN